MGVVPSFFKPRIQNKLILAFLFVGLLPMLLSTYIVVRINSERLEEEMEERIRKAGQETLRKIGEYEQEAVSFIEEWTGKPDFEATLSRWEQDWQEQHRRPVIVSAASRVLWQPGRLEGIDYESRTTVKTIFDISRWETLLAGAIAPIGGEEPSNLLVGYELGKSFAADIERLTGVEVQIYRKLPHIGEKEMEVIHDLPLRPEVANKVFREKSAFYDAKGKFRGEAYQALYQPLVGSTGKMVGLIFFGIPRRYTFRATVGTWRFFPLLIGLGVLMAAGFGYTIARGLSKPIRLFARGARAIAEGDLNQTIPVTSKDEIGELCSAFNQMTEKLRGLRELEDELRRKDRLAALGELSAGVAHEIRNPLGIIRNSAQMLRSKIKGKDKELSNFIIEEVDRLNRVVSSFLDFARPQEPNFREEDVNSLLDKALLLVEPSSLSGKVELIKSYQENLPQAWMDPEQCRQVFLNLIINALQAMPQGGSLSISSKLIVDGSQQRFVEIRFEDSGCGIPKDDLEKVFNPFFSTKDSGAGLGLSVVHRIVENHQGNISVESSPGKGTTFILQLPVKMSSRSEV